MQFAACWREHPQWRAISAPLNRGFVSSMSRKPMSTKFPQETSQIYSAPPFGETFRRAAKESPLIRWWMIDRGRQPRCLLSLFPPQLPLPAFDSESMNSTATPIHFVRTIRNRAENPASSIRNPMHRYRHKYIKFRGARLFQSIRDCSNSARY